MWGAPDPSTRRQWGTTHTCPVRGLYTLSCPVRGLNCAARWWHCIRCRADLARPSHVFVPHAEPQLRRQWGATHTCRADLAHPSNAVMPHREPQLRSQWETTHAWCAGLAHPSRAVVPYRELQLRRQGATYVVRRRAGEGARFEWLSVASCEQERSGVQDSAPRLRSWDATE